MNRLTQSVFTLVNVICLLCALCFVVAAQVRRPNIVVIVADDMGYADVGIHGSKDIPTPNIDDGIAHIRIELAAKRSALENRPVAISEIG